MKRAGWIDAAKGQLPEGSRRPFFYPGYPIRELCAETYGLSAYVRNCGCGCVANPER